MPFTFAHPLYAFPLRRLKPAYFSMTGLILGSMAPDYEYFIALEPYQLIGHTHAGLLLEAIPLSVLFAFLFHRIIRLPLVMHLPTSYDLDARAAKLVKPWKLDSFYKWLVFLVSVAIGFYSHLFLDGFTHKSGYFVQQLPFLQNTVAGIPIYKIGQHSLSLIGLLVQAILLAALLRRTPAVSGKLARSGSRQKLNFWLIAVVIALITVTLKLILSDSTNYVGIVVVASISGGMLGLFVSSVIWTLTRR